MRALLVAEKSVLPILPAVLHGLDKWKIAQNITVVVPPSQMEAFAHFQSDAVTVISEQEVLGRFTIDYIAGRLGEYAWRAGWYLQQFVKLEFARMTSEPAYLIWDADTVPLAPVELFSEGRWQLNHAREFHQPYFEVFTRLFGTRPTLRFSLISQYLPVSSLRAREMLDTVEHRHAAHWIDATLNALPLRGHSEFSEYETYGNFMALRHPEELRIVKNRWFRHGSDVLEVHRLSDPARLQRVFKDYSYVAFERRRHGSVKRALANVLLKMRVSS
jgi:hypothetical protein